MSEEMLMDIRSAVQSEIQTQVKNLFGNELSPKAKELILTCPQLINRFAEKLDSALEILNEDDPVLEPIEIQHVGYSQEIMGYDK